MPSHFQRYWLAWRLQGGPHACLHQSPTYLKVTPASSNMSLAAVVSSLSWYLSDMKITSFIPEKITVADKPGHKMQKRQSLVPVINCLSQGSLQTKSSY